MSRHPTTQTPIPAASDDPERLAIRRARLRFGWIVHATVFVVVNAVLALLAWATGRHWAVFPLLGWGLGLAIHGAAVLLAGAGTRLYQRLLEQERSRLAGDPW